MTETLYRLLQSLEGSGARSLGRFATVISALTVVATVSGLMQTVITRRHTEVSPPTLDARIQELSKALSSASATISGIEAEVGARQALLERLQRDAQTAEAIARLNSPQAEAVAQLLRREIDRDQSKQFWIGFTLNIGFAIFGAILGVAASEGWRWLRRRRGGAIRATPNKGQTAAADRAQSVGGK